MNKAHIKKLEIVIGRLEMPQKELLRSTKHKNDTAIEDMERAKTSLLRALRTAD